MDHFLGCFTISRCKCDSARCSFAADVSITPVVQVHAGEEDLDGQHQDVDRTLRGRVS